MLGKCETKFKNLLDNLRSYKFRNYDSIQYLFFVINIDNNLQSIVDIKQPENAPDKVKNVND